MDAEPAALGSQDFAYLGPKLFTGNPGELRCANSVVVGDIDGDGMADVQIAVHSVDKLAAGDFLL